MPQEIEFKIDAWTPETIPQERLGAYLIEISKFYGEAADIHFRTLKHGSAVLVSTIAETASPKVERRLRLINGGAASKDAVDAYKQIDKMLADDNAVGEITLGGCDLVVNFPGRTRPKPVEYGPFKEDGFLEGELIRIGGRDKSVHLALQDGDVTYSNIETDRETARKLGALIYGPVVRLWGVGTWRRSSQGKWLLEKFIVARFEVLENYSLADALQDMRAVQGSEWNLEHDPISTLLAERADEEQAG